MLFLKFAIDVGIRNVRKLPEVLEFNAIRQSLVSDSENAGRELTYA